MFPLPLKPVFKDVSPLRVIGPAKERLFFAVAIDPPSATAPVPLCVKGPLTEIAPAAVLVNVPVLLMERVKGPLPVVVIEEPRTIELALIEMPDAPEVARAPLKSAVPVPAVSVMLSACIPCVVTLLAPLIDKLPIGVKDPILLLNKTGPPLDVRARSKAPSIVFEKVIVPPAKVESKLALARIVVGLEIKILPRAIIGPATKRGPVPITL